MKKILIILAAIIAVSGVIWFFTQNDSSNGPSGEQQTQNIQSEENTNTDTSTPDDTAKTFTAAQVAEHNTEQDCWTIIRGGVYDLTSYVARHPGGNEILRACGTDATTLFETRTTAGGEEVGSGTPHSSDAQEQLASLKVGTMSQ